MGADTAATLLVLSCGSVKMRLLDFVCKPHAVSQSASAIIELQEAACDAAADFISVTVIGNISTRCARVHFNW